MNVLAKETTLLDDLSICKKMGFVTYAVSCWTYPIYVGDGIASAATTKWGRAVQGPYIRSPIRSSGEVQQRIAIALIRNSGRKDGK